MSKEPPGWIAQLDGLRGISILMVLTAHVYAPGWHELQGGYGVTVFFVLSGFLITRLLLREEYETSGISLAAFYVRRAFRLFPLYYLVLGVYCVLILALKLHPDGRAGFIEALPWYLTYLQDFPYFRDRSMSGGHISVPFYQSWSLGIEEKFYLLWPILAFRALRKPNSRIVLAVAAVLFFSAARFVPHGQFIYPYAAICWGCLFALLYETATFRTATVGLTSSWRAALVFLTWPVLHVMVSYTALPAAAQLFADLAYPLAVALVILVSLQWSWLAGILSFQPLVVLGRYSYCIYLVHLLARQAVERVLHRMGIGPGNGILVFLLMLLVSVAIASVLYWAVELRFRELGRRISNSWPGKTRRSDQRSTNLDEVVVEAG